MKKRNLIIFIIILAMGLVWGVVYWYLIAPYMDVGALAL